jgi:hypothetical protein
MTLPLGLLQLDPEEDEEEVSGEAMILETFATRAMRFPFNPIDGEMVKIDGKDVPHLERAHHLREEERLHVIVGMKENSQSLLILIEPG